MRLIDADALVYTMLYGGRGCTPLILTPKTIAEAPTVEAEPVRHGKWIKTEWRAICSECGKGGSIFDEPVNPFNYCPHCGAKKED